MTSLQTSRPVPLLVVVTGPPGSGKTTVARALAQRLRVPYLSKDDFKERLYDVYGSGGERESLAERAALSLLLAVADNELSAGVSLLVESNFHDADVGALLDLVNDACMVVQVHCGGDAAALADSFAERAASGERHAGHDDSPADRDEVVAKIEGGFWDPLELPGALIAVDGTQDVDADAVADEIRALATGEAPSAAR